MNENEDYFSFEDRVYLNPTQSRDEQLSFIDTLRETQANNTTQINADTYALGSQLPSSLGGLRGGEETFAARYQRPQTEATIADLRTAAQQSALNQALTNLQSAWKKRYNDAILNYQRRAATPSTNKTNDDNKEEEIVTDTTTEGTINPDTLLPDGTPNAIVSGPAGTTAISPDGGQYTDYTNENGETVRQWNNGKIEIIANSQTTSVGTTRESVNDAIKRLESQGKTVTNKRIQADDNGNVVLTWRDQNGNEGSETIVVDINYRGTGLF